nr:reverse transcriptase domain-containing protein [Tanacetum cinerariifolium]
VNHFRQRSGDRHQLTSQQSSHRSHGHHNDCHGSDRRGGNDNHRGNNNNDNYSSSNNRKNTTTSTSGQADKKPGASGRVFAITEGQAVSTSGTITGTLFIYGHAVFVLFDTGATH